MEVLKLATKTLQVAIQTAIAGLKTVVDAIKTTTDATKAKVDTTATKVDSIDAKVGALLDGRIVKSVQRGIVSMSTSVISIPVTIAPVGVNKSVLEFSFHSNGSDPSVAGNITSATQINFARSVNTGAYIYIEWQVIEFY